VTRSLQDLSVPILKNAPFEDTPLIQRLLFYYGWINVIVAALAMTATLPGRTHGIGLIAKPLCDESHITDGLFNCMNFWAIMLGPGFLCRRAYCSIGWAHVSPLRPSLWH
jgi:hypothetical protein